MMLGEKISSHSVRSISKNSWLKKKDEFQNINDGLGDKINDLFGELYHEYKRQVHALA